MFYREYTVKKITQGRLIKGSDIIEDIKAFLKEKTIQSGIISGIGAVSKVNIGYYDQKERTYKTKAFDEPMEILSLKGNISIKDHEPFPHLHGVFSRQDGSCIGGHIFEGTEVFAFEFEIIELTGDAFIRYYDEDTGLYLWTK